MNKIKINRTHRKIVNIKKIYKQNRSKDLQIID